MVPFRKGTIPEFSLKEGSYGSKKGQLCTLASTSDLPVTTGVDPMCL